MRWDAVVVGSGLGGLSAAAHLAAAGQRVLVCEQYDVAGGSSQVFRRKRQWQFDVGLHYVGGVRTGEIGSVLGGLGLRDRVEWAEMDPDGFDTLVFPRHTVRVPKGWDRYEERVVAALPAEEEQSVSRCIGVLRSVARDLRTVAIPKTARQYAAYALRARSAVTWGMRPMTALFDRFGLSDQARAIVFAQSGDYATPPSRTPVALHAGLLDHYLHEGAYYVRGGGQTIAAHLVDLIHTHGGRVRTRARVDHIAVERGRVKGVLLETGEEIRASTVVSTADIKQTFLGLLDERAVSPRFRQRVRKFRMAMPLFCVYLGLDRDLRETMPSTNYWVHPDYDPERPYTLAAQGQLPDPPATYITSASVKDHDSAHHAPNGCSTLELMTWVPPDPAAWGVPSAHAPAARYRKDRSYREVKAQLTEKLIDVAQAVVGDVRGHVVWKEAATPLTHTRYTLSSDGTSYGIELATDQIGPRRPAAKTPIGGLFLAGASTRSGHGIVGALVGGREAASAALGRDLQGEAGRGAVFADVEQLTAGGPGFDALEACRRLQDKSARARHARVAA
jgi:all-trans-retinol 13,14-reductase